MDNNAEHNLLETVIAGARRRFGIAIDIAELDPELNSQHVEALIRIHHGGQAVTYAAEVKRGLRPSTLVVVPINWLMADFLAWHQS